MRVNEENCEMSVSSSLLLKRLFRAKSGVDTVWTHQRGNDGALQMETHLNEAIEAMAVMMSVFGRLLLLLEPREPRLNHGSPPLFLVSRDGEFVAPEKPKMQRDAKTQERDLITQLTPVDLNCGARGESNCRRGWIFRMSSMSSLVPGVV
jgi:hypothetical protein